MLTDPAAIHPQIYAPTTWPTVEMTTESAGYRIGWRPTDENDSIAWLMESAIDTHDGRQLHALVRLWPSASASAPTPSGTPMLEVPPILASGPVEVLQLVESWVVRVLEEASTCSVNPDAATQARTAFRRVVDAASWVRTRAHQQQVVPGVFHASSVASLAQSLQRLDEALVAFQQYMAFPQAPPRQQQAINMQSTPRDCENVFRGLLEGADQRLAARSIPSARGQVSPEAAQQLHVGQPAQVFAVDELDEATRRELMLGGLGAAAGATEAGAVDPSDAPSDWRRHQVNMQNIPAQYMQGLRFEQIRTRRTEAENAAIRSQLEAAGAIRTPDGPPDDPPASPEAASPPPAQDVGDAMAREYEQLRRAIDEEALRPRLMGGFMDRAADEQGAATGEQAVAAGRQSLQPNSNGDAVGRGTIQAAYEQNRGGFGAGQVSTQEVQALSRRATELEAALAASRPTQPPESPQRAKPAAEGIQPPKPPQPKLRPMRMTHESQSSK